MSISESPAWISQVKMKRIDVNMNRRDEIDRRCRTKATTPVHDCRHSQPERCHAHTTYPEWATADHLGENAANRPHVHAKGILLGAEENFGGTVPQGNDFVRVGLDRNGKGTGKTKVGDFEVSSLVNKDVSRLQVAVDNTVAVAVINAAKKLHDE